MVPESAVFDKPFACGEKAAAFSPLICPAGFAA
jgi:hypothetical protein